MTKRLLTARLLVAAVVTSLAALSACKRDAEPALAVMEQKTAAPAQDATAQPSPSDVQVVSDAPHAPVSPEAAAAATTFDQKAYAGTFSDGGTHLKISADGMFELEQGGSRIGGTWTLEKDGEHLLFDPESKSEPDRRYKMVGNDELQAVAGAEQTLRRDKA